MIVHQFGRSVQIKALPIGIPYQRFEDLSRTSPRVLPSDIKVGFLLEQHSLLICTWFLKNRVWKIKSDELDFLSISNLSFTACVACKIRWLQFLVLGEAIKDLGSWYNFLTHLLVHFLSSTNKKCFETPKFHNYPFYKETF